MDTQPLSFFSGTGFDNREGSFHRGDGGVWGQAFGRFHSNQRSGRFARRGEATRPDHIGQDSRTLPSLSDQRPPCRDGRLIPACCYRYRTADRRTRHRTGGHLCPTGGDGLPSGPLRRRDQGVHAIYNEADRDDYLKLGFATFYLNRN